MSEPLSASERAALIGELDAALAAPAPESNVPYLSTAESARLVARALALGLGRFRVSEHDHRLALERERPRA
jgi:diaminopimelate decarboxylase